MKLNQKAEGSFYTLGEEIGNAVTHGIGAVIAIVGTVFMIIQSAGNLLNIVASAIYGFTLILLFGMSSLYHSVTNVQAKRILRVFDHTSIFLLIAGTYTPMSLVCLGGAAGWTIFGIVWAAAVFGIIINIISIERFKKISMLCYIASGWTIVFAIGPLVHALPWQGILLLFLGGFFYTFGVIFYKQKQINYMHMVWHFFVLAGAVCHYFCVSLYVI